MNNNVLRTRLDDSALLDAADTLQKIQLACIKTTRGLSLSDACREQNLDYVAVRTMLLSAPFGRCDLATERKSFKWDISKCLNGYERLYSAVFGLKNDLTQIDLPVDYKDTVENVLKTLSEREADMLKRNFGIDPYTEPMTYADTAKDYDLTANRIMQIVAKSLRSLRWGSRHEELLKGSIQFQAEQVIEVAKIEEHRRRVEERKVQSLQAIKDAEDDGSFDSEMIRIENLGLSVRSYNCLKRTGVSTLVELMDMSDEDLMRVRNLGQNSLKEIIAKRDEFVAKMLQQAQDTGSGCVNEIYEG